MLLQALLAAVKAKLAVELASCRCHGTGEAGQFLESEGSTLDRLAEELVTWRLDHGSDARGRAPRGF